MVTGRPNLSDTSVGQTLAVAQVIVHPSYKDMTHDSGGPLFANSGGQPLQIGVVSYGQSCALPKFPGVYSELNNPAIRSWITANADV